MVNLIIEGVAGTGKSSILSVLQKAPDLKDALFISEEETLGELFSELRDKSIPTSQHLKRLQAIMLRLNSTNVPIILERFHHSYFALGIPWDSLKSIDARLCQLNFKTALLDFSESALIARTLKRKERAHDKWEEGFIDLYGSAEAAVNAFKVSQQLRHQSLGLSHLKSRIFDTEKMDWDQTAHSILTFAKSEQ